MQVLIRSGCLVVLLGACSAGVETSTTVQALQCSPFVCGENSPYCGLAPFHELHPTMTSSQTGIQVVSFTKSGYPPMQVRAKGAKLVGTYGDTVVQGLDLMNSVLRVADTFHNRVYDVTITGLVEFTYYEDGNDGTPVEAYQLEYADAGQSTYRKVCDVWDPDVSAEWGAPTTYAVVFGGDRYDTTAGVVSASGAAAGSWINVGCIGDTKAKLLLTRHAEAASTPATSTPAFPTTQAQRTAMLRMFRADYCGNGTAHTILGVPLDWKNIGGWNYLDPGNDPTPDNIEAIWNEHGALCVTHPRHVALEDIGCSRMPRCTSRSINDWIAMGGQLMSVLPP